ncbi:MAG TPA: hypothetical protein VHM25_06650 [Polyangiaceae bacterium]|nr:hypothetical protein [Polyangiaceae bacterium]
MALAAGRVGRLHAFRDEFRGQAEFIQDFEDFGLDLVGVDLLDWAGAPSLFEGLRAAVVRHLAVPAIDVVRTEPGATVPAMENVDQRVRSLHVRIRAPLDREHSLHGVEQFTRDQRLLRPAVPLAVVLQLADVRPVVEDVADVGIVPIGIAAILDAERTQPVPNDGGRSLACKQLEDLANNRCLFRSDFELPCVIGVTEGQPTPEPHALRGHLATLRLDLPPNETAEILGEPSHLQFHQLAFGRIVKAQRRRL